MTLLTKGTLYVARLTGDGAADGRYDGTGQWIRLTTDKESFVPGMSVADVLIDTRLAADSMSPTKMDRPEDVEPNPVSGKIYAALTNNTSRGNGAMPVDEATPVTGNKHGYVLEMTENAGDHAGTAFSWMLLLVGGDPNDRRRTSAAPQGPGQPPQLPRRPRVRPSGQPLDLDRRQRARLPRRPVPGAAHRRHARPGPAVPLDARRRRDVRAADQRRPSHGIRRRAAPRRESGSTFETPSSTWPHTDAFPRPSAVATYRA
jgi:hypothetical protein